MDMKKKHILLIFLLALALLLIGAQVRYRSLGIDLAFSPLLYAFTAFILVKKKVLKGKWKYWLLPLSLFFWYVFAFVFDNIFSNSHKWEFISVGTPNMLLCMVGATYGALLASAGRLRLAGATLLIVSGVFSFWFAGKGKDYWVNYCNTSSFTGKIDGPKIAGWQKVIQADTSLQAINLNGKYVVLDFWSIACVACFRKFPYLDSLNKQYKNNSNIVFRAVNLPIPDDSIKFERIHELDTKYTFHNVLADSAAGPIFDVSRVPIVIILKDDQIVFRGSIELAKDFLAENLK
jgi:thiol-disulfide isomerase/thioredoxin